MALASQDRREVSEMYFFRGNYDRLPVQGGQFILHRHRSRQCLQRWRHLIDANPRESKDQKSLRTMWNQTQQANWQADPNVDCRIVVMEQEPHLCFPNTKRITETLKKTKTKKQKQIQSTKMTTAKQAHEHEHDSEFVTLNHIKNTHHAQNIDRKLQQRFIAALLNLTAAEIHDLGVADKMIFGA
uniref:Uncharacterized protein n=1 Tax=Craspedostauros australis TaxID=1486917 RepID=A0A7R9WWS5_9STRA